MKGLLYKWLVFVFLLINTAVFAQEKASSKLANELFNDGNFSAALAQYLKLLEENPDESKLNYRVGVCYLNTNIDKSNAIPYFEKVLTKPNPEPNTIYLLGRAYHFAYRFPEAIKMYKKFKTLN